MRNLPTPKLPVVPDEVIAKKYINKISNCVDRDIPFSLSLHSYINIFRSRKYYYTSLPLDFNNITIDRIDSSKGYVKGNVVACHKDFNKFKSYLENHSTNLNYENATKGINRMARILNIK